MVSTTAFFVITPPVGQGEKRVPGRFPPPCGTKSRRRRRGKKARSPRRADRRSSAWSGTSPAAPAQTSQRVAADDDEHFIPAKSYRQLFPVLFPRVKLCFPAARHVLEHRVAGQMPIAAIDLLEVVQIHHRRIDVEAQHIHSSACCLVQFMLSLFLCILSAPHIAAHRKEASHGFPPLCSSLRTQSGAFFC